MEVPDDFNFSDLAHSPELKRRRKNVGFQKPTDALTEHLLLPVPIKISRGLDQFLPTIQEIPHSLSWRKGAITQTPGADVKSSDFSKPKYMKRSREIKNKIKKNKRQDFGVQHIVHQYKLSVQRKYESVLSFLCGEQESFSAQYTEPVIVQKNANGSFKKICVLDLFMLFDPITVVLRGNSGSGKSIMAQKIILDWASEAVPAKRFDLVFYLRCEELMCISEEMNFIELLSCSCSLTTDEISQVLQQPPEDNDVLFIIDGFDELKLTHGIYHHMSQYADPLQKAPPEVIICALLRGRILPESFLLVTTRTQDTVIKLLKGQSYFTEMMGFYEKEVERYFKKVFLIKAYYSVIADETLFTACSIPVICRIISETVKFGAVTRRLEMTTSIYIDFVCTLLEHHFQGLSKPVPTLLMSLGHLAERGMLEQQVLFDENTVYKTVSDPAGSPFLRKFLFKRRIHKETMFSFMHLSFQEFFTALYYILLDEEESQKKVRELLHAVERGWAFTSWTDRDVSVADSEISTSKWLQPVIPFLCGLCKNEWISTVFEKHNMAVSTSRETQLKEWISQFSQRYQNEHMLLILHCLYELHDKSFVWTILRGLILIDLSKIPLKMTDCWVLKYCLQCCEHIRNLKLQVTSDNLRMLQPELYRCEELWLMMDHISDDDVGLISAAGKGKNTLIIKFLENSGSPFCPESVSVRDGDITLSVCSLMLTEASLNTELTLTCPDSLMSTIKWAKLKNLQALYKFRYVDLQEEEEEVCLLTHMQSVSDLKRVCLQVSNLTKILATHILYLIQSCPSLTVLRINIRHELKEEKIQSLKESLTQMGWIMTVWWKSMFIQPDPERFTKKIKREKCDSKIEESSYSVSYPSIKPESSSPQSSSDDAEVFTPELIHRDEDKHKNTYRFLCQNAGQFHCSLTNLVFVMEGVGNILYNIVSWDPHLLDGLGQMQPAGPLYNIECTGSVSKMHLPHCEIFSEENKDGLAVAHFTGGNIEMIQPFNVTGTHVIIDMKDLSPFGLIRKIESFFRSPIAGQVLLFLRPVTAEQKEKILNVHLLPGNVPVSEVQSWHHDKKYIETSSKCHLFAGREYSLCCQPDECEVQPQSEMFERNNFSENYHPMFEVFLDVNSKEVRLGIVDKSEDGREVWNRRRILLTAPSQVVEPTAHRTITESEFLNRHRDELIQRVSSVMVIADGLKSKDMIDREMYSKVHAAEPRQEKMRLLFDVIDSGGTSVKVEFYRLLKAIEPHAVDELVGTQQTTVMLKNLSQFQT